jgi:arabinose-5-phosphate isomerase
MLESMRETLALEAAEIERLRARLGPAFEEAGRAILECEGRTIASGIGKAGDIAKKFSSTLSSTGTPSLFLHAAEAVHGDLGMVTARDIVVLFSNSGETEEVLRLFPALRQIGAKTILITGRPCSTAAKASDLVLDVSVQREACPHDLAPTTSTTVMLALSDALALAVMKERRFTPDDYALYHPSGALGRRLLMKVRDAMRTGDDLALVPPTCPFLEVLGAITKAGAGAACVVSEDGSLLGLISDGDIRRRLVADAPATLASEAAALMNSSPRTINPELSALEALDLFESLPAKIGEMPVVEDGKVVGLVMLKDLVRLGLV